MTPGIQKDTTNSNRYRNIVISLENLLAQLGTEAEDEKFFIRIETAREIYRHEMTWHRNQWPTLPGLSRHEE